MFAYDDDDRKKEILPGGWKLEMFTVMYAFW